MTGAELAPPAVPASSALERAAEAWIGGYFNARHLRRTRDWAVALEPAATEALRLAALTHDMERSVPGGPRLDPRRQAWDDAGYLREHSERSATLVSGWLESEGAEPGLRDRVRELILRHEIGGDPESDLLQAADSLSFLEVNAGRAVDWVKEGRSTIHQAQAKLDWMHERVAVPAAARPAAALHAEATEALLSATGDAATPPPGTR